MEMKEEENKLVYALKGEMLGKVQNALVSKLPGKKTYSG